MHASRILPALLLCMCAAPAFGDETTDTLDEKTLQEAGIGVDGASLLNFFKARTLSNADRARLSGTVRRLGDASHFVREKASQDLVRAGRPARTFLKSAVADADLEISHRATLCLEVLESSSAVALELAAARLLGARKPEGSAAGILAYLPFADDDLVEEELLTTLLATGLHNGEASSVLIEALKDPSAPKRAAAALAAGRSTQGEQRALVRPLLLDRDPKVRLRAALGLLAGREKDAVASLLPLLSDSPREVAWQAEEALCRLAGEQAPMASVGAGAAADRLKCQQAWEAWWRGQPKALDLARLEIDRRSLGLTLYVAFDGYGNQGKVWEARADGKPRWEIASVQGPINAQVLPGNRVLIAEHNARRITERDLTGKVLWEFSVGTSYPVACQRLPNGNTFVATYTHVLEVTPDRKEVFSVPCRHGMFYSAQKLRNGHVVAMTSSSVLVELDVKGVEVRTVKLGAPAGWATVEALPGGRFLVSDFKTGKVLELDAEGRTVATYAAPNANAASKLPNGNVLICRHNDRSVVEIDRAGKELSVQRLEGRPFWAQRR